MDNNSRKSCTCAVMSDEPLHHVLDCKFRQAFESRVKRAAIACAFSVCMLIGMVAALMAGQLEALVVMLAGTLAVNYVAAML